MIRPPANSSSDADRWQRVSACFEQALETPFESRVQFVETTFPDDPESRREVLEMLSASQDLGLLQGDAAGIFQPAGNRETDAPLEAGELIGAYRVDERVGRGGMGDVYRAHRADGLYEQQVAIKLLRGGLWGDALTHRFALERQILARLQHPDIVGIIDGGTTANARPFLVMPFVDGQPITDYCAAKGLGLIERLRLFIRVANAVQYAHTRLIVHRDIKPTNILVTSEGEVRLLDFGIAKLLNSDADAGDAPRSTVRMFTPEFSAPEQVAGGTITAATDVHALGVLLYQLVSNERPNAMPGRSARELENAILNVDPPAPSTINSGYQWRDKLRGDLDLIILKALRKEPDRRYATAAQFSDDVERFLSGLPVQAVGDSAGYRTRRFIQRHRVGVISSAVLAVGLAAVAIFTTVQARRLRMERDRVRSEQVATNTVVNLLQSLFARSNPGVFPGGDSLRVAQLLDVGELMVDSLSSQPIVQARMWRALGNMHNSRGRSDKAKELLKRSYDRFRTAEGSDSVDVISTLHEYARLVGFYDGREAALPLFRETVDRLRHNVPDTSSDLRVAQRELSLALTDEKERLVALEKLVGKTRTIANKDDSIAHASDLNSLAVDRYGAGDFKKALALFTEVFDILTATLPKAHPDRLLLMGNVAATRDKLGDYVGGEALARQLVTARRAENPIGPIALAAALEYLANSTARRGYLNDADTLMREVTVLRRANLPKGHTDIIRALQNRAAIAMARNRRTDAMLLADSAWKMLAESNISAIGDRASVRARWLQTLIEARELTSAEQEIADLTPIVRKAFPETHPTSMMMEMNRGTLALQRSQWNEAIAAFSAAEQALLQRLPPEHAEVAGARCGRALALAGLGKSPEAKPIVNSSCVRYRRYGLASPTILSRLN